MLFSFFRRLFADRVVQVFVTPETDDFHAEFFVLTRHGRLFSLADHEGEEWIERPLPPALTPGANSAAPI